MKLRSINTRIWDDTWISELTPNEKLVWLYLLTNQLTNLIGVYEITMKRIAFDTGLPIDTVRKAIECFQRQKKAFYFENHIMLVNFYANQSMNPKMIIGAKKVFDELPENIKHHILSNPLKGYRTLSNGIDRVRKDEYEYEDELECEYEVEKEIEVENEKKDFSFDFEKSFEEFRQAYPGVKRGLETEFKDLKKHKDWKQIVPLLQSALKQQYHAREKNRENGHFVPEWKHLKTYISQRGWEEEINIKPLTDKTNGTKNESFNLERAFAKIDAMFEPKQSVPGGGGDGGAFVFD